MLKKIKFLNYNRQYSYAPPVEDGIINTDEIVSIIPTEARGSGPFVTIKFKNGSDMVCVGGVDDFIQ